MSISLDELGQFLRQPPPRDIPHNIRRRRLRATGGCVVYTFGILFGGFGSVFVAVFFPWRIGEEMFLDLSTRAVVQGKITAVEETNTEVNDQKVNCVRYEFTTPQGQGAAGVCYGRAFGDPVGAAATVEYLPDRPAISRIVGCTAIPFGYVSAIVTIFPIIGFGLVAGQWTVRRRALRLLRDGVFAMAKVTEVKRTNVEINDERRFRVSVSLAAEGGELVTGYNAYGADVQMAESRLASGEPVGVLYDPARPNRLYIVEKLLG